VKSPFTHQSITTNQEAIRQLFRVINRYVGNLPPMPGVFPDYPDTCRLQLWDRTGTRPDALGHAPTAAHRWTAGDQHPEYDFTALARLAEA
jgi:hypothetical protein